MTKPKFFFKVIRVHRSCLERQVHEGIRISTEGALNSKAEWRQNQLKLNNTLPVSKPLHSLALFREFPYDLSSGDSCVYTNYLKKKVPNI